MSVERMEEIVGIRAQSCTLHTKHDILPKSFINRKSIKDRCFICTQVNVKRKLKKTELELGSAKE